MYKCEIKERWTQASINACSLGARGKLPFGNSGSLGYLPKTIKPVISQSRLDYCVRKD